MLSISFILIRLISTSGIPSTTINGSELLMEPKPRTFSEAPSPPANRLFGSLPIPAPNPRDWKIRLWWNGWQSFHRLYCCNRTGQVYFLLSSITHYNDLIQCLRVFREGYYYIGSTFKGTSWVMYPMKDTTRVALDEASMLKCPSMSVIVPPVLSFTLY